jgi:hypothetical protein
MEEKKYSIDELSTLWDFYQESKSFSVLKNGEWNHAIVQHNKTIKPDGTACKIQPTRKVMTFIEFLESLNGTK